MKDFKVLKPFRHGAEMVKANDIIKLEPFQARQLGNYVELYKKPIVKETKIIEEKYNG